MVTTQSGNVISGTMQSGAAAPLSIITSLTSAERDIRRRSLLLFIFFLSLFLSPPPSRLLPNIWPPSEPPNCRTQRLRRRVSRLSPRCERLSLIAWPITPEPTDAAPPRRHTWPLYECSQHSGPRPRMKWVSERRLISPPRPPLLTPPPPAALFPCP